MLVEDKESNRTCTNLLCEVAQVHESALCEKRKISVTEPDEEAAASLVINAWVLTHSFRATKTCTGIKDELVDTFFRVQVRHR